MPNRKLLNGWLAALALAVSCWVLVNPAPANAIETGLADSEPNTFDSPLLVGANVDRFRVIVPWDVATRAPGSAFYARREMFDQWIAEFLAFKSSHSSATFNVGFERINTPESTHPMFGRAPTEAQYRAAFSAFASAYGTHKAYMRIDPWNEPNYNPDNGSRPLLPSGTAYLDQEDGGSCNTSSPSVSSCGPRMAAFYYRWAYDECPTCNLEAGEFAGGVSPDYIQKYKHHLGEFRPTVWGVHNYGDMLQYSVYGEHAPEELRKMVREIFCINTSNTGVDLGENHHCTSSTNWRSGHIWVTATGAAHSYACKKHKGLPACLADPTRTHVVLGQDKQCDAVAWMLRWGNIDTRITRVYHYTYMDANSPANDDDTGIVEANGTTGRKAYNALRSPANPDCTSPPPSVVEAPHWYLRSTNETVSSDMLVTYGSKGDVPVAGDWNDDGFDTPGIVRGGNVWHLRNSITSGPADISFTFGNPTGMQPIVGDWNGDGEDSPGMFTTGAAAGTWHLRSTSGLSSTTSSFQYGTGTSNPFPVPGDWNKDLSDTPGIRVGNMWYLRNSNIGGISEVNFAYGNPSGHIPLSGDWNGDGYATPGVYETSTSKFHLSNSLGGPADKTFQYGNPGDTPVVGDWNKDGVDTVGVVRPEPL